MATGGADSAVGAILEIPPTALNKIEKAEKALLSLHEQSKKTANQIYGDFNTRMPMGVDTFIKKLADAQKALDNLKSPTLNISVGTFDGAAIAKSISEVAVALASMDRSATTGANRLSRLADSITKLNAANPSPQIFQDIANGITAIGNTSQQTIQNVSLLAQAMATLARDIRTVQNAQNAGGAGNESVAKINQLYNERIRVMKQMEELYTKSLILQKQGLVLSDKELQMMVDLRTRWLALDAAVKTLENKNLNTQQTDAVLKGRIATTQAEVAAIEKRNKAIEKLDRDLTKKNEQEAKERKRIIDKYLSERAVRPENAIRNAQNAKTLADLKKAYENLRIAMSNAKPDSKVWNQMNTVYRQTKAEIDEIRKKMGEFNSQTGKASNMASQLRNSLAAAFSVSSIVGYLKKIAEVRAQFELQNVALRAILQDKAEADRIFGQVQQMALQSPFTIMQLNTYTKQLAAYRIEASKLVGTTKMLADVSAGLGVDMQRLILAYGQVKAANYLRASEVRQFTEAGLNIAGELATYFSELQGKMVSVGDVMDMITKRMVRFEDVEEVFKRVTSAGGLFYDMQKKQSESIYGQMQRISDAYSIMMNEIGKSNDGIIKFVLTTIRDMIQSWRTVVPFIKTAAMAIGAYVVVGKMLPMTVAYLNNTRLAWLAIAASTRTATAAQTAFNVATKANPWGLIASAMALVISAFWEFANAQSAMSEEIERLQSESISDMYTLMYRYRELADTVADVTTPYKERKEALDELNRSYKDILPQEMLEIKNIQRMKGSYDEATEAIRAYSLEKLRVRQKEVMNEAIQKEMESAKKQLMGFASEFADVNKELKDVPEEQIKGTINNIFTVITSEVLAGTLSVDDVMDEFYKRFAKFYDIDNFVTDKRKTTYTNGPIKGFVAMSAAITQAIDGNFKKSEKFLQERAKEIWNNPIGEIFTIGYWKDSAISADVFKDLTKAINGLEDEYGELDAAIGTYSSEAERKMAESAKSQIENFKEVKKELGDLNGAILSYYALQQQGGLLDENGKLTEMGKSARKGIESALEPLSEYMGGLKDIPNLVDDIIASTTDNISLNEKYGNIALKIYGNLRNEMNAVAKETNNTYLEGFVKKLDAATDQIAGSDVQRKFKQVAKSVSEMYGVNLKFFDKIKVTSESSLQDVRKQIEDTRKAFEEQLKSYNSALAEAQKIPSIVDKEAYALDVSGLSKEMVDGASNAITALNVMFKLLGGIITQASKGKDPVQKQWENRHDALKKYYAAAEKGRKHLSESEAKAQQETSFKKLFEELGMNEIEGLSLKDLLAKGLDPSKLKKDYVTALEELIKFIPEKYKDLRNKIQEEIASESIEITFKVKEQEREKLQSDINKMFDSFNLSKEFKKIGVPIDMIYMLGGTPTTLDDIRKKYDSLMIGFEEKAEEEQKIIKKMGEDLEKQELSDLKERAQKYGKYLKAMYSERAKTMIEAYATMSELQADYQKYISQLESKRQDPNASAEKKNRLTEQISILRRQAAEAATGIKKELDESMAKMDWNDFKGSDIFTQMYQDVSTLSKKGIDTLIGQLEEIRAKLQSVSNIDPKAVREVTQYIEKLKNAKGDLAPYAAFKESIAAAKKLKQEYGSVENAQLALANANTQIISTKQEIADLETIIDLKNKGYNLDAESNGLTERQQSLYNSYKDTLLGTLDIARSRLSNEENTADELSQQLSAASAAVMHYNKQKTILESIGQSISSITDSAFEMMDAFGVDVDDEWKNFTKTLIDGTMQAIMLKFQLEMIKATCPGLGAALNSALGVIGWIATGLSVASSLLSAILGNKDKTLEKKITKIRRDVDKLSRSYEKLKTKIDNALSFSEIVSNTDKAIANAKKQQESYEEMIRLEQSKKKTDKDKIIEYQNAIEDLEDEIKELEKEKLKAFGGFGTDENIKSASEEFADAWVESFRETGDGLSGLEDKFEDFAYNMLKKQIWGKLAAKYIEPILTSIDNAFDENGVMDPEKWNNTIKMLKDLNFGEFDAIAKQIAEALGFRPNGNLLLSDLQKGIQNITEPQAAAIEAYLNSMRFAVFSQNEKLDTLIASIQEQYGTGDSPMLKEVKLIRGVLENIHTTLKSVIKSGIGGSFVKVGS